MNCITPTNDDGPDDASATAYLSIIQHLPSADYRAPHETPSNHHVSNERSFEKSPTRHTEPTEEHSDDEEDDEIPFNMLCGDETNEDEDSEAAGCACTMVDADEDGSIADEGNLLALDTSLNRTSTSQSIKSVCSQDWDDFERGRNAGSPSRAGRRTKNLENHHKAAMEEKRDERDSAKKKESEEKSPISLNCRREHDIIKSDALVEEQLKNTPKKGSNKMMSVLSKMKHSPEKENNLSNKPSAAIKYVPSEERSTKTTVTAKTTAAGNVTKKKKKVLKMKNSPHEKEVPAIDCMTWEVRKLEDFKSAGQRGEGLENAEERGDGSCSKGKSNISPSEILKVITKKAQVSAAKESNGHGASNKDATKTKSKGFEAIEDHDDESKSARIQVHETAPTSATKHVKVDETIAPASSFSTANETDSTSNNSSSLPQEGTGKKRGSPKFLRRLKTKRSHELGTIESSDPALESVEDAALDNLKMGTVVETLEVTRKNGNNDNLHLMALTPKDRAAVSPVTIYVDDRGEANKRALRYDEICNVSPSPQAMTTPATPASPAGTLQFNSSFLDSIVVTEVQSNEMALPQKSDDKMACNLSPIVKKPSIERAITDDSVELDVTGITMAITPDSRDDPILSRDSASLSERCRSFLSDVSRTLFPEEIEVSKVNESVYRDFDKGFTFECMLQKDESGMYDVTVAEGELNEFRGLEEKVNERTCVTDRSKGGMKQIASAVNNVPKLEAPKSKASSFNSLFQMDVFKLVEVFGCTGAPPVETPLQAVTVEGRDKIASISRDYDNMSHRTELEEPSFSGISLSDDVFDGTREIEAASTVSEDSDGGRETTNENQDVDVGCERADQMDKIPPPSGKPPSLSWVRSLRSRSQSIRSQSMRMRSFGFGSNIESALVPKLIEEVTPRLSSTTNHATLQVLDEIVEATI